MEDDNNRRLWLQTGATQQRQHPWVYAPRERMRGSGFYSKASFVVATAPVAILLLVAVFCFILSGGEGSDNDRGAVWWLLIGAISVLGPVAIVTNTVAVILGTIGLRKQRTKFGWAGIIIVFLQIVTVLWITK